MVQPILLFLSISVEMDLVKMMEYAGKHRIPLSVNAQSVSLEHFVKQVRFNVLWVLHCKNDDSM